MSLKRIHELSDVKSFYNENGYLIIDDFISEFEADNLKHLLEKHVSSDYNNMLNMDRYEFLVAQSLEKINKLNKISEKVDYLEVCKETSRVFRKLLLDKRLLDIIEFLYDEDSIGLSTHMIWKKAGTKYATQSWTPHQDNSNVQNKDRKMITVNIMLDDHTKENGCIYNYPGSHKEGLAEVIEIGTGYGNSKSPGHKVNIPNEFKKEDVIANKGTLYLQHGNLIHGSYENKTKNQTRGMYSATYLPKGSKFLPGGNSRRRVMNEL